MIEAPYPNKSKPPNIVTPAQLVVLSFDPATTHPSASNLDNAVQLVDYYTQTTQLSRNYLLQTVHPAGHFTIDNSKSLIPQDSLSAFSFNVEVMVINKVG